MLTLGSLAFASPWILLALAALPALIWLMRVTPPAPKRITFPAVRLMLGLSSEEESSMRTPLWLLLLRTLATALVILALAQPILNPNTAINGEGTVLLVVDDSWATAADWQSRRATLLSLIDQADRQDRPIAILTTAPPADGTVAELRGIGTAAVARDRIQSLKPKPWPTDRTAALSALKSAALDGPVEIFWLSDGLAQPSSVSLPKDRDESTRAFALALANLGPVHMFERPEDAMPLLLAPLVKDGTDLAIEIRRPAAAGEKTVWLRASGDRSQILARHKVTLASGANTATLTLELPPELRNRIARIEIEQETSAGAVLLLDERWRRRPIGLVAGAAINEDQPLLSGLHYIDRAVIPFAEVRRGTIARLLDRELSVMVLADVGKVVGPDATNLEQWVANGGVLIRFAGPRMAQDNDELLPARLRPGERNLGGAMTWTEPARLAPFSQTSPFFGLAVPDEVKVSRQVLAEPTHDIGDKTWARLEDGTPLVTGSRFGAGWIVLFHTTANTSWSNLPLSGLFVEMLQTIVRLAQGVEGQRSKTLLPPLANLDGFGLLGGPAPAARPLTSDAIANAILPGPQNPPGFYGTEDSRQALNLGTALAPPQLLDELPSNITRSPFVEKQEHDLMPLLLTTAIILILAEMIASLKLRGLLRWGSATAALLALAITNGTPHSALAQSGSFAMAAALETRLAYVLTTNAEVDRVSELGLLGLTRVMAGRTAIEAAYPVGVNPERHELAFFPLLYWPMTAEQPELSPVALANVDAYLKNGGTILFDTRDQPEGGFGTGTTGTVTLRRLLSQLDVPPLISVPEEHVLTKAFYLLETFPGRYQGSPVWVVKHAGGINDGVSSLVIGAHDWAAAWALDDDGWPLAAVSSNDERQRELAYRFGINLVMYTLTGSYKADQVHLPVIMERLGE